jgi:lysozyme family protein
MNAFARVFSFVVGEEGGFDTAAADPGNWTSGRVGVGELRGTKFGISAAAYPNQDIINLTTADAQTIYKRDYWDPVRGDVLPTGLALLVFDAAVNNGVKRAIVWLQIAAGVEADGVIGAATIAAATSPETIVQVCSEFLAQRMFFMATLGTWRTFGLGWSRRLASLPFKAVSMGS